MRTHSTLALLSFVTIVVAACGSKTPPPKMAAAPPPAPAPREVHERVVPHTCGMRSKLAQMLGQSAPAPAPAPEETADSAPPPTSTAAGGALAGTDAYRLVAPATVLVRTKEGFGTGVIVDPKGYVLTNHHIVATGEAKDFVLHVDVNLGDLTPTGRMARQDKTYSGIVVKDDPIRDLALVKIENPPAKLPSIKLATSAPQIGEKVMSVGHAGIGFLWAAKSCSIASVGERQQDASLLAGFDCTKSGDGSGDAADAPKSASATDTEAREKKQCDAVKKMVTDAFAATTQGLAIQTDCATTHGDSGGPLVNAAGDLVGLNQAIAADLATASFHVHVDEIRDFIKKYGDEGVAVLPDPVCDGGFSPELADLDLDGTPDTIVARGGGSLLSGSPKMSFLIDLDEDHFAKARGPLDPFDTEVALLMTLEKAYVFYDVDNDGRYDYLLVDEKNDGKPDAAYKLDGEGHAKKETGPLPAHDLDASLVKDAALHARLGKIATVIGAARFTSPDAVAAAAKSSALPDPYAVGTSGAFLDSDGDGKPDAVLVRGTYNRGFLLDANEKSIGTFKSGEPADDVLKAKKVDAQVSALFQGDAGWVFYDTDGDDKFDLVLMTNNTSNPSSLFTTSAFHLGAGGELTPAPDQLGRKLLRPGLVALPRARTAIGVMGYGYARDEASGTLPDPRPPRAHFAFHDVKGFPKGTVIEAIGTNSTRTLIDLDLKSALPASADAEKVARDPKTHAEIAIVRHSDAEWIYYDTDADNKFDLVLYMPSGASEPTAAYRLKPASDKDGSAATITSDAQAAPGRPLRTKSVLKNKAQAARWKALAGKLFQASSVEN